MTTKKHSTPYESSGAAEDDAGLSPQQVRHLPKPRSGFIALVAPLATLFEKSAGKLGTPPMTPAELRAQASAYQQKLQVELQLEQQLRVAREERLQCGSRLWSTMLALYAIAQAAARSDKNIRSAVSQLASFFKNTHKSKATTPATQP